METHLSRRSFEQIHGDYSFFLAHSTEPAACRAAMLEVMGKKFPKRGSLKMLDFGCGGGEFLEGLLRDWNWPGENLDLALVEVDGGYLEAARKKLAPFSVNPVLTSATMEKIEEPVDLITSNHVLYYVKDLSETLGLLLNRLKKSGTAILILGGRENQLCRLWELVFTGGRKPLPYYLSTDVQAALENLAAETTLRSIRSVLRFPDTGENRHKILRFLFEGKLGEILPETLSGHMDDWSVNGEIVMENVDQCFVVGWE